jgi:undecaprenyl phosphate-alpha-L-ara4N flippase subunit ArnE
MIHLNLSPAAWFGLIFTPLLISTGQVLFKVTSARTGAFDVQGLAGIFGNPALIAALILYALGTVIWIFTLKSAPLTLAYSFMALTFCFVPVFAALFLGEALTLRYAAGAALIVGGMVIINS